MRLGHSLLCLPLALAAACIDTQTPPEPTRQASVPYGPRIFLKDGTIEELGDRCKLIGTETYTSTMARTSSTVPDLVGGALIEDPTKAWNCYIDVTPGTIVSDIVEVTNAQFQLCVDSDICKKPDPAEVDKIPVCASEDDFDRCPVVSVTQAEATRYCEFVGRRLPSGIEAIVLRQPNQPQTAAAVQLYPTGMGAPDNCDKAVLKDCGKPQPITLEENGAATGAAFLDKTTQGIFDLTGNASEWTADLIPSLRGDAEGLPWFCAASIPAIGTSSAAPVCPSGEACIRGTYQHPVTRVVGDYPVCIADRNLVLASGVRGSVMGGNYSTSTDEVSRAGTFVRSKRDKPNADSNLGDVGFRCVDAPATPSRMVPVLTP